MQPQARKLTSDTPPSDVLGRHLCAVVAHDRQAFEYVYAETVDRVLGLATRIVGDSSIAEDVASDVYLQVWRQAERFDPERGSAIAWIMTIARSRALDAVRRRATSAAKTDEFVECKLDDDAAPMHDLLDATRRESSLHRALSQLNMADRQLLALAYFRGYTHKQLAEIADQPLGTVKTRIRRALVKLRGLVIDSNQAAGEST